MHIQPGTERMKGIIEIQSKCESNKYVHQIL